MSAFPDHQQAAYRQRVFAWSLFVIPLLATGCQSVGYQAASLPPELLAPAGRGASQLQAASLAATAPSSELLGPGDLLGVTILSGVEDEASEPNQVRVADDGTIDVPLVGPVRVAGVDPVEANRLVAQASVARGVYVHPNVHIEVQSKAVNRVTVLGAVANPGVHEVPVGSSSVVAALAVAGGLTEEAGVEIEVVRQTRSTWLADAATEAPPANGDIDDGVVLAAYESLATSTAAKPVVPSGPMTERISLAQRLSPPQQKLGDGDVVMVLSKEERNIFVSGLVNKPDQYSLPEDHDLRVLDALAMAGGRTTPAANRVIVIRRRPDVGSAVIRVTISRAKQDPHENLILAPGDLVSVESTLATSMADAAKNFLRVTLGVTGTGVTF